MSSSRDGEGREDLLHKDSEEHEEGLLAGPADVVSPNSSDSFSPLQHKPNLPLRSTRRSLDKRSYDVFEMTDSDVKRSSVDKGDDVLAGGHLPPMAFRKTHHFFWWDLGYWRMPARHFSIFTVLFLVTFLPGWYSQQGFQTIQNQDPTAFTTDCVDSTGWSFVGINMKFGTFTFGQAKAIDLAWNWVIGRGLQGVLTLIAYRVFSDALLRAAEISALSYELYVTLALPSTKIDLFWQVMKGLFKFGNWRVKAIFVWLMISTIHLIAIPGLMDAATAYEAAYDTIFEWPNGTTTSIEKLRNWENDKKIVELVPLCLKFNHPASYSWWTDYESMANITYFYLPTNQDPEDYNCSAAEGTNPAPKAGEPYKHATDEFSAYKWQDSDVNASWWKNFETDPYISLEHSYWPLWNFAPVVRKNFKCISGVGTYKWGFSFEWCFLITILNGVWLWGLWILWLDCDTNSEFCKKRRRLGTWRAIADISEAMRAELGPNICAYSDADLLNALRKRAPLKYCATRETEDAPAHIGLSSRKSGRFVIQWDREYGYEKKLA